MIRWRAHGRPLSLSSAEAFGGSLGQVIEFKIVEEFQGSFLPLRALDYGEGGLYILLDGEGGDEVEELEDESYVVEPEVG